MLDPTQLRPFSACCELVVWRDTEWVRTLLIAPLQTAGGFRCDEQRLEDSVDRAWDQRSSGVIVMRVAQAFRGMNGRRKTAWIEPPGAAGSMDDDSARETVTGKNGQTGKLYLPTDMVAGLRKACGSYELDPTTTVQTVRLLAVDWVTGAYGRGWSWEEFLGRLKAAQPSANPTRKSLLRQASVLEAADIINRHDVLSGGATEELFFMPRVGVTRQRSGPRPKNSSATRVRRPTSKAPVLALPEPGSPSPSSPDAEPTELPPADGLIKRLLTGWKRKT